MIRVIKAINTTKPPAERETVHHITRMPHFSPSIATDTTGMGIIGRKKRRYRLDDKNIVSGTFPQMLHTIVISLNARSNFRITITICLDRSVTQKIQFQTFDSGILKFIYKKVDAGKCSRGCRIHTRCTGFPLNLTENFQ